MQLKIERIDDKQVVDKLQIASDKKIIPCKVPTYLLIWLDCIQNGKKILVLTLLNRSGREGKENIE